MQPRQLSSGQGASTAPRKSAWRVHDPDEDRRLAEDAPVRVKRAQVKNACVNCQRACKKCDPGRPCERCIKYGLEDSCEDSKRKPRKKGLKRGPYKKRKKNPDTTQPPAGSAAGTGTDSAAGTGDDVGPPGSSDNPAESSQRRPRFADKPRPRQILGPGAVAILHSDPQQDDRSSPTSTASSSSDTPLQARQRNWAAAATVVATADSAPETPTAGLTAAFGTLAPPSSHPPARSSTAIRLPPITSFDKAQAQDQAQAQARPSSLAILTDVALSRTHPPRRPHRASLSSHPHSVQPTDASLLSPSLPASARSDDQPASDVEQQSLLRPPDSHSRHSTTTGESDASSLYASSVDLSTSPKPDAALDTSINRLSRQLQDASLDQDSASEL
ncbi:hypothetical protein GGI07_004281 [Coemansia sp. Benny D115]|nr:hypothetical protein GGI07_004281 [Coemansia sp. Benny D115]